ncbi:meiosis expressed gene 1 protein homolog isoform X2 [Hydractinia symbiolongicarpus]|uniref:meiosis expressed gene 1 protein homolog isoform X2 n=1 Tax=Hydractinia symbiolongicarpus TaxID=13093 RepID=UPI00254F5422|nr:meiosis expressed gene 1 protein homolog isoform X2 [Hydractinia symbiolongicarpus]
MSYARVKSSGYGKQKSSKFPLSPQPKSILRPKRWDEEVEEAYRFQLAGYRDEKEYLEIKKDGVDRWPDSGYVKKLQRRDGTFYYYSRRRECTEKDRIFVRNLVTG